MRVLKVSIVYGEDTPETMPTPLCDPLASTWFSVAVPSDDVSKSAQITADVFCEHLAELLEQAHTAGLFEEEQG